MQLRTSGDEDDIGLGIAAVHDVSALEDGLLGGAGQVGHALSRERQHGRPHLALWVHSLCVEDCRLHAQWDRQVRSNMVVYVVQYDVDVPIHTG